ncbi:MAG: chloramphenicol O-acetyltransferase type [Geotoga sp.]|nr:chloramphenicol O-acetyltransferase type [Geotoga sp.]
MNIIYYWAKLVKKLRGSAIKNSKIHKTAKIGSGSHIVNSTFGKYSYCGYDCQIINADIGSFCSIANNVVIGMGEHPINWVSTSPVFYENRNFSKLKFSTHKREPVKRTKIGNDVWIGERVLIKQGVSVGDGAIIGMGSVVTKDVEPYTIVAGVPAKVIRKRFEDYIIEELEKIKWWDFDEEKLKDMLNILLILNCLLRR